MVNLELCVLIIVYLKYSGYQEPITQRMSVSITQRTSVSMYMQMKLEVLQISVHI